MNRPRLHFVSVPSAFEICNGQTGGSQSRQTAQEPGYPERPARLVAGRAATHSNLSDLGEMVFTIMGCVSIGKVSPENFANRHAVFLLPPSVDEWCR